MLEIISREWIYFWYYFTVQLEQILPYWVIGMLVGSAISVFAKDRIHNVFRRLNGEKLGIVGIVAASVLGIASPLCMYGTIPIAASFSRSGVRDDWLAAFMMSSVLLNPQLILYSAALGSTALVIRITACLLCGVAAGILIRVFYKDKQFFIFTGFAEPESRDIDPRMLFRFLKNLGRNIKATGLFFLIGIILSALFQQYVPAELVADLFGDNRGFGVLLAATIGVPLYACGGGTIPLLQAWLFDGMSMGSAAAFMITGPATKITNLGALKIVLGAKRFGFYFLFTVFFALVTGWLVDLVL